MLEKQKHLRNKVNISRRIVYLEKSKRCKEKTSSYDVLYYVRQRVKYANIYGIFSELYSNTKKKCVNPWILFIFGKIWTREKYGSGNIDLIFAYFMK